MTSDGQINNSDVRLRYKKGDLIIKEGDYGISIYRILSGKVLVYAEAGEEEIPLAKLGPGDVIGEMVFLDQKIERRSASARALEPTEVESWHPRELAQEYEKMPPILKNISDQALSRLTRMNRLIPQLAQKKGQKKEMPKSRPLGSEKRRHYRKDVDLRADCRPLGAAGKTIMPGVIRDLSMGGLGLEMRSPSAGKFPYKVKDEFMIRTMLPNGKEVQAKAHILSVKPGDKTGTVFLGMCFSGLTDTASKEIGFFLMPS